MVSSQLNAVSVHDLSQQRHGKHTVMMFHCRTPEKGITDKGYFLVLRDARCLLLEHH